MNKYLNKLNAGMFICEKITQEKEPYMVEDIQGIKDIIKSDEDVNVTFHFLCVLDFIEFEIPKDEEFLSFRFFIRTIGTKNFSLIPFIIAETHIAKNVDGVMTHRMSLDMSIEKFNLPQKGKYAIEVYKHFGEINREYEKEDEEYYRRNENFLNALQFTVV